MIVWFACVWEYVFYRHCFAVLPVLIVSEISFHVKSLDFRSSSVLSSSKDQCPFTNVGSRTFFQCCSHALLFRPGIFDAMSFHFPSPNCWMADFRSSSSSAVHSTLFFFARGEEVISSPGLFNICARTLEQGSSTHSDTFVLNLPTFV